jgi:hypothetical protein
MGEPTREERHQAIWAALRGAVCSVCLDRKDDGRCGLSGGRTCGLEAHLPRILEVLETVQTSPMEGYVEAIRQNVCVSCEHDLRGVCRLRSDGECALDAYLPLVVEAVKEAQRTLKEWPA